MYCGILWVYGWWEGAVTPQRGLFLGVVEYTGFHMTAPVSPRYLITSCIKMEANLLEK